MSPADIAVRVDGLGKRYRIGGPSASEMTLRSSIQEFARAPGRQFRRAFRGVAEAEMIWAVRDLTFEVERGTALGIVGRNGAGKSTLLKILSRITEPTTGYADIYGRLSSLLEVGTGFHAELTGRENVYLNGAILGMSRAEVRRKFDQIVDFSGVEKFIDTPMKRYSSGMYMRLAFAVAAHLEPDILIVDEVLAVGDAEFQQKSLGKMEEVSEQGRTVLFVSHNMALVKALCDRAILLEGGRVVADGETGRVIDRYLSSHIKADETGAIPDGADRIGTQEAHFVAVTVANREGEGLELLHLGQPFEITAVVRAESRIRDAVFEFGISTPDGTRITTSFSSDAGGPLVELLPGESSISLELDAVLLPGRYTVDLVLHHGLGSGYTIDHVDRIADFEALPMAEDGQDRYRSATVRGFVRPEGRWRLPESVHIPAGQRRLTKE